MFTNKNEITKIVKAAFYIEHTKQFKYSYMGLVVEL